MTNVRVEFSQVLPNTSEAIGFIVEDQGAKDVTILQLKWWSTVHLHRWIELQRLQGNVNFYRSIPIKIEGYINEQLVERFTQKRVTKYTVIKEDEDVPFSFLGTPYLLINTEKNFKQKTFIKEPILKYFNSEKYFNSIEHSLQEFQKVYSPILFTGLTQ